ncbi:MAG: leucine-rich repeat protein [Bacteroidota bacterium]|nr:leucine-rich repeat protein [Bacteroidota bacterium]
MKTNYLFKRAFLAAFFVFNVLSIGSLFADAVVVNGVAFNVVNGAAEVAALPDGTKYTGTLTIPASVTIDGTAYNVLKIGNNSLRDAPALTGVVIPDGLKDVGNSAFAGCTGITNIVLPASVDTIEDWAFYACSNLATINIPDGITAITEHTFQQTGLTGITLPASVKTLRVCAFQDAHNLASINLENITGIVAWALYGTAITTANVSNVFAIGGEAFRKCPNLTTVVLRNVASTGGWTFEGCPKLTTVDLGELQTLDQGAFSGCSALTTLTIPNTVVFMDAWSLEKTGITKMYASWEDPANSVSIDANAFGADAGKINFTWMVPATLLDIYGSDFMGYPVQQTDIAELKNVQLENAGVYFASGNLNLKGFQGYKVSVVSIDGRTVAHFPVSEVNAQVPVSLTSGIYMINAIQGNNRAVAKFIVR